MERKYDFSLSFHGDITLDLAGEYHNLGYNYTSRFPLVPWLYNFQVSGKNIFKDFDFVTDVPYDKLKEEFQKNGFKVKETGKNLTIAMGIRTPEEQDILYCKGRPKDKYCLSKKLPTQGKIITYKKGGESNHNFGKAFDVYFNENGVVNVNKEITSDVVNIGKQLGLEWGGDFRNFHDDPHFQLPGASKI